MHRCHLEDNGWNLINDFYRLYRYYHFYAICFGLGWGAALYRPFHSLVVPSVLGVIFTVMFEVMGVVSGIPADSGTCRGFIFGQKDVFVGFCFAFFVAILNLNMSYVYTLSYGSGIIAFALCGAIRKISSLRKLRES